MHGLGDFESEAASVGMGRGRRARSGVRWMSCIFVEGVLLVEMVEGSGWWEIPRLTKLVMMGLSR